MFDSSELRAELQALKGDVSRLLNTTSEGIFDTSKNRAEALADQIKSALNELGETLGDLAQLATRGDRDHHVIRCFPAQLLGHLEGEGL